MQVKPLRFLHRGQLREIQNVPPTRTLLQLIREDLHLCGTKEGCNEGDCGACVVALREPGASEFKAVNSCIRFAHSIEGLELTTVEDLSCARQLHPAQEALMQCHGSQCGFCTPGFVMSMFALHENSLVSQQPVDRSAAQVALSGNLCRCTGYRPILDAAVKMQTLSKGEHSAQDTYRLDAKNAYKNASQTASGSYLLPTTLAQLLALRSAHPEAQIVAGCTDVGLWVNKGHQQFAQILDVTRVAELRRVERYPHHIAIGAAVSLHVAYAALVQDRPQLKTFAERFAGLPVRNSGTLGGNVANGSPIGDSMPLLIALKANVVLMSVRGHREMPLETLYTGYRKNVMRPDEVLAWIKVPLPTASEFSRVYKISKRYDDDISAVCLAISVQRNGDGLRAMSIGVGGVAATPVRAIKTEALCADSMPANGLFDAIKTSLQAEFQPISDMRASGAYRRELLGALVDRFASDWRGEKLVSLESWDALQEVLV
ncbi:xanthine dehydrogenase small subunit [Variovorax sp. PCZ-1]|uniref:xanthine dehydrogenase small subunit n=1 Tax=Variovorax sp. PCZ-1 TaxID=2835533 RepID=UPI001BD051A6|nr:xanthine dehydrogenase small subunit [Variovorax sp. PCZ-1]MBS7808974.1 xanthine dehydrogenase small subunit [Variovorax sp. PCZ-1]